MAAGPGVLDRHPETLLGDAHQPLRLGVDPAHPDRAAHVGPEAVQHQAEVEAHDVALGEAPLAGDAVHGLVVDRHADRVREAVVTEEARAGSGGADALLGEAVEVDGPNARADGLLQGVHDGLQGPSRPGHHLDLVRRLVVDHRSLPSAPKGIPDPRLSETARRVRRPSRLLRWPPGFAAGSPRWSRHRPPR